MMGQGLGKEFQREEGLTGVEERWTREGEN